MGGLIGTLLAIVATTGDNSATVQNAGYVDVSQQVESEVVTPEQEDSHDETN